MTRSTVMMTGGGTGGHVFPLIAVADALRRRSAALDIVFVGTERGLEAAIVPAHGYRLELLKSEPARGGRLSGLVRGAWRAGASVPEALRLLRRHQPRVVFSLGGYASVSVSLAARLLGIPVALMEPNSVVGLANRLAAPFVARAYVAFPAAGSAFRRSVVRETGVALRSGFEPRPYGYRGGPLRVLVLGGSQGARALNETLPAALARARVPIRVVHQTGEGRDEAVRATYARLGASASSEVVPFIDDMAERLAAADLVIARAGASHIAEITALGRPSILVPYPYAAGNHQLSNALAIEQLGAAVCLLEDQASVLRLAALVDELAADVARLERMADAARRAGRPNAADIVALDLIGVAGLDTGAPPRADGDEPGRMRNPAAGSAGGAEPWAGP